MAFLSSTTLVLAGGAAAACTLLRLPVVARRAMAWTVTWVAVWLGGMQVGALLRLVDATDAMASGSINSSTTLALLAGMLLGVPVAALAREHPHAIPATAPPPAGLPRLPADGDPTWRSAPLTSRAVIVVLVATGLLLVIPGVVVGPFGEGAWLLLAVATLAPATVCARVHVDIDRDGLHVRGLGVRFAHVPIAEVASADVVEHLDPLWEFGGWGLRVDMHGRTGIVSRAGPALRVVRGDDTELLITVDDAATAAATLHTLADRHHRQPPGPSEEPPGAAGTRRRS